MWAPRAERQGVLAAPLRTPSPTRMGSRHSLRRSCPLIRLDFTCSLTLTRFVASQLNRAHENTGPISSTSRPATDLCVLRVTRYRRHPCCASQQSSSAAKRLNNWRAVHKVVHHHPCRHPQARHRPAGAINQGQGAGRGVPGLRLTLSWLLSAGLAAAICLGWQGVDEYHPARHVRVVLPLQGKRSTGGGGRLSTRPHRGFEARCEACSSPACAACTSASTYITPAHVAYPTRPPLTRPPTWKPALPSRSSSRGPWAPSSPSAAACSSCAAACSRPSASAASSAAPPLPALPLPASPSACLLPSLPPTAHSTRRDRCCATSDPLPLPPPCAAASAAARQSKLNARWAGQTQEQQRQAEDCITLLVWLLRQRQDALNITPWLPTWPTLQAAPPANACRRGAPHRRHSPGWSRCLC